jgi:hypothetical protein
MLQLRSRRAALLHEASMMGDVVRRADAVVARTFYMPNECLAALSTSFPDRQSERQGDGGFVAAHAR